MPTSTGARTTRRRPSRPPWWRRSRWWVPWRRSATISRRGAPRAPPPCSSTAISQRCAPWPSWCSAEAASVEAEGRVLVSHETDIDADAEGPAQDADHERPKALGPFAGDEHGEEGDDRNDVHRNEEDEEHDVVGDGQQPLDEDQPAAEV